MKIGFFTDSFRPYTSGVVRSIELFSGNSPPVGTRSMCLAPITPSPAPSLSEKVFRFISIPAPTMPDFALPIPISANLGPTICRIGWISSMPIPLSSGRPRCQGCPALSTTPGIYISYQYDQYVHYLPLAETATRQLVRNVSRDFCNKYCRLVVALPKRWRLISTILALRPKLETIPTGIDLNEFQSADPGWLKTYLIGERDRVLLFVGRLSKEKILAS